MLQISNIKTICVCGAGTMGSGIAQLCAQNGYNTIQFDLSDEMLLKSKQAIAASLQKLTEKNKITARDANAALERIRFTNNVQDCKADLVIEAIVEIKDVKVRLINQLAAINSTETIYATNTSSISIKEIAEATSVPNRIAGMHFFNPPVLMQLVEVIQHDLVKKECVDILIELAKRLSKLPVLCKDAPGFIVNRVARPYYLAALRMVEQGLADIETIDTVMEAAGFKMGPFKLMDLIGIDVNYSVSNIVWNALGKPPRLQPSALQKSKLDNGELGRKTGKGFYDYGKNN